MNLVANENNTFAADENNTLVGIETPDPSQVYTKDQVDGLFQKKQDSNLETTVKTVVGGINELNVDKQDKTDDSLQTTSKTVVGAINETNSIAKGANQALTYRNYATVVSTFNALGADVLNKGQNVYVVTMDVPDLWVSDKVSTSATYTYVDDETMIQDIIDNDGQLQIGYYKLSMLETQKVDLTQYYTKTETDAIIGPIEEDLSTAKENIHNLQEDVGDLDENKVDKEDGKGLSTNDYTNAEKEKLSDLENYDDTEVRGLVTGLQQSKADKTALAKTDRSLDFLYKLTQGQAWDFDRDDNNAYEASVPSGAKLATVQKYGGHSVVMNQWAKSFIPNNGWTAESGVTFSFEDGVANIATTITNHGLLNHNANIVSGHKYYIACEAKTDDENATHFTIGSYGLTLMQQRFEIVSDNIWRRFESVKTASSNNDTAVAYPTVANSYVQIRNYIMVDLTQMFGAGNEPTTVEEVKAILPNDYYDYNTGEVIHADVDKVVEQGVNAWDEEWENGYLKSDGTVGSIATRIVSKNNIPCKPNAIYNYASPTSCRVCFYDYNENFVLYSDVTKNTTFTTPNNASYMKFSPFDTYHSGEANPMAYYNDISINRVSTDNSYHAYRHNDILIPQAIRNLEGYGWSAGSVYNEVDFERKKFIKRVAKYTVLSTDAWLIGGTNAYAYMQIAIDQSRTVITYNIIADKLPNDINTIRIDQIGRLLVSFPAGAYTVQTIAEAMTGITIYYELGTPEEIDITDILEPFEVEAGGTITFNNSNGDGYRLPVPSTEEYIVKLSEVVSNG